MTAFLRGFVAIALIGVAGTALWGQVFMDSYLGVLVWAFHAFQQLAQAIADWVLEAFNS